MKIEKFVNLNTLLISFISFLAISKYLNISVAAVFIFSASLNIANLKRTRFWLPRIIVNIAGLSAIVVAFFNFNIENMNVIFLNALVTIMALKLMEEKKYRDYMQISLMAVFTLAGLSLLNLSMLFLIYIFSEVILIILQLVLLTAMINDANITVNKRYFKKLLKPVFIILVISVPGAILLFIILPRTNYPMLDFLNNRQSATTGFTDEIKLGNVKTIQSNDKTAFRAEMEKIDSDLLYWRGVVLDTYKQNGWTSSKELRIKSNNQNTGNNTETGYKIYMEPSNQKFLYTLNFPEKISYDSEFKFYQKRGEVVTKDKINSKIVYSASSETSKKLETNLKNKSAYLKLPEIEIEIQNIANRLNSDDPSETAENILNFLLSDKFAYSLKDLDVSGNPLYNFLLKSRQGNCEYFASAMGVLLRMNDIPARLVGGYRGGYYNNTGFYSVMYSNAHVWVEAYIKGHWKTYDPTPANFNSYTDSGELSTLKQIRLVFEKMNYYWSIFVINYDFTKQVEGIKNVSESISAIKWKTPEFNKTLFFAILIISTVFACFIISKKHSSPGKKVLSYFDKIFQKYGSGREKGEGLINASEKISDKNLRSNIQVIIREYYYKVYSKNYFSKKEAAVLIKKLKNILKTN